jgi:hypothetical protein
MTKSETPNADALSIGISKDARWFMFDFTIGTKHAVITMGIKSIASAAESMLNALALVPRRALPRKGLPPKRVYESPVIRLVGYGVATAPLADRVVVEFELPGRVELRIALVPRDAEKLGSALLAGAAKAKQASNLTRQ